MCRGATTSNASQHPHYGSVSGFSSLDPLPVVPPILSFPYLQHPSQNTAIEDALARAQSEAALWRAGFEKGQKLALRNDAADGDLRRVEGAGPTSVAAALSDAFAPQQNMGSDQPVLPSHRARTPTEPWMSAFRGGARKLAQSSTEKQEQTPATPSNVAWDFSTAFDDADSFKDLTDLIIPTDSAPPETNAFTPPAIKNELTQRCVDYAAPGAVYQTDNSPTFWQGGRYSQGFTYPQHLKDYVGASTVGPGWSLATPLLVNPPVYCTPVADVAELLEPPASPVIAFAPSQKRAPMVERSSREVPFVGKQAMGMSQHPGGTQARWVRQPSAGVQPSSGIACTPKELTVGGRERGAGPVTPKSEVLELSASCTGGATRQCVAPGCTRRPSYGVVFGSSEDDRGGARWCRTHAADGMVDTRNPKCSCVGDRGMACRAQPSFGFKGDRRPSRCRTHAEDGMENVRMARCHQEGCQRQPLYGEAGMDKKPTHCRTHALPGMRDLRGAMCQGAEGTCGKRPSYGFRGDPRPTRCGTHKEVGMEDLISARCHFGNCRTVASYGVQAFGSHVIRRTRCKAHRTAEMTCGTKGPACMNPGGCETRPSYGWLDKCDDEAPPRPQRCKKHSLPGMEYMGSAARAKRRRAMAEEEAAPVLSLLACQNTTAAAVRPLFIPPTERTRPVRKRAASAAPIIGLKDDGEWYDTNRYSEHTQEGLRNWPPEGRMQVESKLESARLAGFQAARARTLTNDQEVQARAERSRSLRELENLGDMKALQELREIEDQADDQMWGSNGLSSTDLEGMLLFDNECFV